MHNRYIETLGLKPGATKVEVKAAFRRLSKIYHPDINKDESAKEQFIAIHEAYKFLTDVGSKPNNEPVSYNYDPEKAAYEERRSKARAYAWQRAQEAQRHQQMQIGKILRVFDYVAFLMLAFNVLLLLDYFLPKEEVVANALSILDVNNIGENDRISRNYVDVKYGNFQIRIDRSEVYQLRKIENVRAVSTRLFAIPLYLEYPNAEGTIRLSQVYSVYKIFGLAIPVIIAIGLLYFYKQRNLDFRLSCAVAMLFVEVIQLVLFFRF